MNKSVFLFYLFALLAFATTANAQQKSNHGHRFEQIDPMLRSPNVYRDADGAPGSQYWQQKADYKIKCSLDTEKQRLTGHEVITYHNNSPNELRYLWLQLDENEHAAWNDKHRQDPSAIRTKMSEGALGGLEIWREQDPNGVEITSIKDAKGKSMKYTINGTMMRVDLDKPLKAGKKLKFEVRWAYNLINRVENPSGGRGGYEYFDDHGNYLYTMAQWFPRMCVYSDFEGWQNKQFLGTGEFALVFGDYDVEITLPSDHVVGATGECTNYKQTLTKTQLSRWKQAQTAKEPVFIVTLDEAKANEKQPISKTTKTWKYKAENVRDFAWTASKKFVWDALAYKGAEGEEAMCMSFYGKEAYPIYSKYSTKAVKHTLEVYSKYTIPYPYPTAQSVEAANGMEYPMICFNPGRAEEDGTYTERAKDIAILVIIHEVGHNYFPMIVNSDERQWAWFDEGINTFLQFIAEQEFDNNYPSRGGPAHLITSYMASPVDRLEPIMTNAENIVDYGSNAYDKPAAGLNILRETIMGRELFDFAFKEYARRWAFKHPTPADFFRTMEEASGVDLDWFWRGWFYGIEPVDISLDSIKWYKVDMESNPETRIDTFTSKRRPPFEHITQIRNREEGIKFAVDQDSTIRDIYTNYQPWNTEDSISTTVFVRYDKLFSDEEKKELFGNKNYYELYFSNKGGLVMPIIIEWTFSDGTKEMQTVPVEIWRKNEDKFRKVFVKEKEVTGIVIDPYKQTADIDVSNNNWPVKELPSRFQVYKSNRMISDKNPMQKAREKSKKIKP